MMEASTSDPALCVEHIRQASSGTKRSPSRTSISIPEILGQRGAAGRGQMCLTPTASLHLSNSSHSTSSALTALLRYPRSELNCAAPGGESVRMEGRTDRLRWNRGLGNGKDTSCVIFGGRFEEYWSGEMSYPIKVALGRSCASSARKIL